MTVHYIDDQVTLHHGDCLDILPTLADNSIDAVICDPPYGISFMGRQWDQPGQLGSRKGKGAGEQMSRSSSYDHTKTRERGGAMAAGEYDLSPSAMLNFQRWCELWATECLRVLKPGGHMLAFGGSRTWHRLAAAIEDAGFEIRDSIAWLYGSGFPKSLDVSKAIDKAAGAERAAIGTAKGARNGNGQNVDYGAFGSAADGSYELTAPATDAAKQWAGWGTALKPAFEPIVVARKPFPGTVAANVLEHGTGALNIDACRVGTTDDTGRVRTRTQPVSGDERSDRSAVMYAAGNHYVSESAPGGRWPTNAVLDHHQAAELDQQSGITPGGSFPARRGADKERNAYGEFAGQDGLTARKTDAGGASRFFPTFRYTAKAPGSERPSADGVSHPTVKPLELMRWLVRLVTPPDGIVLDPFAGSGTTGEAAIHEHKRAVLIEREPSYLPLIVARLSKPMAVGFDFGEPA